MQARRGAWGLNTYACHCQLLLPSPSPQPTLPPPNPFRQPDVTYDDVGGAGDALEKLREVVELPLLHPERFLTLGIDPPKVLLISEGQRPYGLAVVQSCQGRNHLMQRTTVTHGSNESRWDSVHVWFLCGRACCCGALPVQARPCPLELWPTAQTLPSSGLLVSSLLRC